VPRLLRVGADEHDARGPGPPEPLRLRGGLERFEELLPDRGLERQVLGAGAHSPIIEERAGEIGPHDAAGAVRAARHGPARPWSTREVLRLRQVATVTFGAFEWDADKAAENAAKHGVTFEEAVTVFLDLDYLLVRDARDPERFVAIGMSSQARVVFVVHCERGEKLRIISARRATRREHEAYERRRESD